MWQWLTHHGFYEAIVNAVVITAFTGIIIGLIVKPITTRLKKAWFVHEATQREIANNLNADTPGGLGDIKQMLEQQNIERGQE